MPSYSMAISYVLRCVKMTSSTVSLRVYLYRLAVNSSGAGLPAQALFAGLLCKVSK